jgi:hypothetical protein
MHSDHGDSLLVTVLTVGPYVTFTLKVEHHTPTTIHPDSQPVMIKIKLAHFY